MPTYTIAANAGVEGAVMVGKLLEQNNLDIGYDAAKGLSPLFFDKCRIRYCLHQIHCLRSEAARNLMEPLVASKKL
jgi:hypothetical protein